MIMLQKPFYDPEKTFEENYNNGPYGAFADGEIYENKGEPTQDFLGYKVYIPFGISAGPLYNGRFIKAALDKGFDIVTQKTVRTGKFPANPFPNILGLPNIKGDLSLTQAAKGVVAKNEYKEPLNVLNSFNNPSFDPEVWQKDLRSVLSYLKKGQVLICSIEPLPNTNPEAFIEDWVRGAKLIKETGVEIVELDTSCPNAGKSHLLCFDIPRMKRIVEKVRDEVGDVKLTIKLSYFEDDHTLDELIQAIGKNVDGIVAINTIPARIIDERGNLKLTTGGKIREVAGASGNSIRWLGLDMTKKLKALREKYNLNYKIIGVGGVTNAGHYQMYKKAGADAVLSAAAAIWNPYLAQEIKEAIKKGK